MNTAPELLCRAAELLRTRDVSGGNYDPDAIAASLLALADSMTAPVVAQRMPYAGGFTAVVFDDKKVPPGTLVFAIRGEKE